MKRQHFSNNFSSKMHLLLYSICDGFHFVENHRSFIKLINIFFCFFFFHLFSSYLWLLFFSFAFVDSSVIVLSLILLHSISCGFVCAVIYEESSASQSTCFPNSSHLIVIHTVFVLHFRLLSRFFVFVC